MWVQKLSKAVGVFDQCILCMYNINLAIPFLLIIDTTLVEVGLGSLSSGYSIVRLTLHS